MGVKVNSIVEDYMYTNFMHSRKGIVHHILGSRIISIHFLGYNSITYSPSHGRSILAKTVQ